MTISWSILILSGYKTLFELKISSTQDFLDNSFDLNYYSLDKFFPSLFPKWLYETIDFGLIPADTKKSVITVLILVYPDLKSSPTTNTSFLQANSITPGKIVFYGEPLI